MDRALENNLPLLSAELAAYDQFRCPTYGGHRAFRLTTSGILLNCRSQDQQLGNVVARGALSVAEDMLKFLCFAQLVQQALVDCHLERS